MFLKLCKRLKCIKYYVNKMLLWSLLRISKVTFRKLKWLVPIMIVFVVLWFWTGDDIDVAKRSLNYPVILWWTKGFPGSSGIKSCLNNVKCKVYSGKNVTKYLNVQAYLFYGSNIKFNDLPKPRQPKDIVWGLYHEESPRNVEELMHEPVLKLFNYSSTFSRYSDVPFPLQYLETFEDINSNSYFVKTSEKNKYLKEIAPVLYLQSDCGTSTERDLYVKELMNFINVDSYGSCLNNKKLPEKFTHNYLNNLNEEEFLKFVARYKFVVAIENGICDDYVTEKFWRAIKVGTVPIYFGCPLIRHWLPNEKSAILLEDYPSPSILSDHLYKLLSNDVHYEQYLEHKTKGIITNMRLIEEFHRRPYQIDSLQTVEQFECFVCKKIYDKINGNSEVRIVNKTHYNCPIPLSALQLSPNPLNSWVNSWEYNREKANELYNNVLNNV